MNDFVINLHTCSMRCLADVVLVIAVDVVVPSLLRISMDKSPCLKLHRDRLPRTVCLI